jgi:8-oxo-dGTP diphosphatase
MTKSKPVIQVAVGIIRNSSGQFLIAKRPEHSLGAGYWEFPGGKIEKGEEVVAALRRELLEEIGITVTDCSPLLKITYEYPERKVILNAWTVEEFTGEASSLEGQEIRWVDPMQLNQMNMLPANRSIVVAAQLPETYLITPQYTNEESFIKRLQQVLQSGIQMVQLRAKSLTTNEYIRLAHKVSKLCRSYGVALLLNHSDLDALNEVDADGVHLRSEQVLQLEKRPLPTSKKVSASCHDLEQLRRAEQLNIDFVVIGPVLEKHCSLGKPLGWTGFAKLVAAANIPVYALGGMNSVDVETAKSFGAHGIAAIRSLWNLSA